MQFTDHNKNMKCCPNKDCSNVVEVPEYADLSDIKCHCGWAFCYSCQNEVHQPCSCQMVEKWLEKEKADSENLVWIKANTKPCPKCKKNIEKN